MGAGDIGYITGAFVTALLLPVLIFVASNFIPAAKRNRRVLYGICGLLAIATPFLAVTGGGSIIDAAVAAALAGALIWWGYTRAVKKAQALTARRP